MSEMESNRRAEEFLEEVRGARAGLFSEFLSFLKDRKKWWLLPILIVLLLVGILVILGGTGVAPFIYTLF
jgi:uncharacterized protein DUF5989